MGYYIASIDHATDCLYFDILVRNKEIFLFFIVRNAFKPLIKISTQA